jgi:hypothetical protein
MLYALRGYRFYRNYVQLTKKELTYELSINFLILYENFQTLYPSAILFNTFTALRIVSIAKH